MNSLVSLNTAEILTKVGYTDEVQDYFTVEGRLLKRPTLWQAHKWLREKFEVYISIEWFKDIYAKFKCKIKSPNFKDKTLLSVERTGSDFESLLDFGIKEACLMVINNKI